MAAKAAFDAELARAVIDRRRSTPGAALPILHDLQHRFGYIDNAADRADGRRAQHLQGRGARRRQLLPRFPPGPGRWPRAQALPRRSPARRWAAKTSSRTLRRGTAWRPTPRTPVAGSTSRRSIASAIARSRPPRFSTASRSAASTGEDRRDCRRRRREERRERAGLRPRRFLRPLRRRGRRRRCAIARGAHRGVDVDDRAQRLARPLLAGAADRDRDPGRPDRLRSGRGCGRRLAVRMRVPGRAARTRRRSDGSTIFPISSGSSGSCSRAAA